MYGAPISSNGASLPHEVEAAPVPRLRAEHAAGVEEIVGAPVQALPDIAGLPLGSFLLSPARYLPAVVLPAVRKLRPPDQRDGSGVRDAQPRSPARD